MLIVPESTFTRMKAAPVAAATARAASASLRSTLTPTGRATARRTSATARVRAATVTLGTSSAKKGASPKFSTRSGVEAGFGQGAGVGDGGGEHRVEVAGEAGSAGQRPEVDHADEGPDHTYARATRRAVAATSPTVVRFGVADRGRRCTTRRHQSPAWPRTT